MIHFDIRVLTSLETYSGYLIFENILKYFSHVIFFLWVVASAYQNFVSINPGILHLHLIPKGPKQFT